MSITNYSELKTAVADWLNRSDLTSYIPDFIALAESRIYRDLRIRSMETALSGTISSGVIALPSGYLDLKYAYIDRSPVQHLQRKSERFIYEHYPTRSSAGTPKFIAREGSNFIFGPYPDSAYTVKGIYYKKLDALSDSNTTNWFTSNAPDLLLYASLSQAEPFLKNDSRIAIWESLYQRVKSQIEMEDRGEDVSGSAPSTTVSWA